MKETLHNALGEDRTRIRRAFRWVVTFRDFPAGSYQTVDGDSMITEALTLFTKGRAEFYLDGVRRNDRVPGTLSSEHEVVGLGGTFMLKYVEPTTRVCIPERANNGALPRVRKMMMAKDEVWAVDPNFQGLICLGSVKVNDHSFYEEQTFRTAKLSFIQALEPSIILQFREPA